MSEHRDDYNAIEHSVNRQLAALGDDVAANRVSVNIVVGKSIDGEDPGMIYREPNRVELSVADAPVDPPTDPVDPPVITPGPAIPQGATPIFVAPSGSDSNTGTEPGAPVVSNERIRERCVDIDRAGGIPAIVYMAGHDYTPIGRLYRARPGWASYKWEDMAGNPDTPLTITRYGDGKRPRFVLDAANPIGVKLWTGSSEVAIIGIGLKGYNNNRSGTGIDSISEGHGLRIEACDFEGCYGIKNTSKAWGATGEQQKRYAVVGNTFHHIYDMPGGSHQQGHYLSGVGGWVHRGNVYYDVGFEIADDGTRSVSTFNQGLYASATCAPVEDARGNVFLYCSGAGAQYRSAGNVSGDFSAFCVERGINWGESRGSSATPYAVWGELTGCVSFCEHGHAISVANLREGHVHHNTGMSRTDAGMVLLARAEVANEGEYFGLSNTLVEANAVHGSADNGGIQLTDDGWNAAGTGPVVVKGNKVSPSIVRWANFADPNGNVIEDGNATVDLSAHSWPEHTPEFIDPILARTVTAAQLIEQWGAHQ